ncbi:MAG TPA: hypothetical protein VFC44_08505 [Candidatus Saccharimonadales bacterium]|nr:hypothetical protein [Candidatus Saccharimonadales bacterium]
MSNKKKEKVMARFPAVTEALQAPGGSHSGGGGIPSQIDTQTPVAAGHLLSTIVTLSLCQGWRKEKNPNVYGLNVPIGRCQSQWVKSGEMVGATGFQTSTSNHAAAAAVAGFLRGSVALMITLTDF